MRLATVIGNSCVLAANRRRFHRKPEHCEMFPGSYFGARQSRTVRSLFAVASVWPSGENASERTQSLWPLKIRIG